MNNVAADPADEHILRARAAALATAPLADTETDGGAVLQFTVADERYGIDASTIREVRRLGDIVPLPHAPATLLGITRIRSSVVGVFDLAGLLDVRAARPAPGGWVVVVDDTVSAPLGLVVDEVEGVAALPMAQLDAAAITADDLGLSMGLLPDGRRMLDARALLALPPPFSTPLAARSAPVQSSRNTSSDTSGTP